MKKLLLLIVIVMTALAMNGQQPAPEILNYQGVARNSVGNVLPNKTITLRITIHDGAATGPSVFQETRSVTTNPFGLFNIQLGSAGYISRTGTIAGVPWGVGLKYIQVEIDPAGGSSFINIGTAQLASVPYALYASYAASSGDLRLPFDRTQADAGTLFKITNSGTSKGSIALEGLTSSTADSVYGIKGTVTTSAPGLFSAGIRGVNNGTGANGIGVWGSQNGGGWGVYGTAESGAGIRGHAATGAGGRFTTGSGLAVHTSGSIRFDGIGEGLNKILRSDASGNATWVDPLTLGIIGGSGTLNFVPKWTPNGTRLGNSQLFDNGTTVAVNTTTPDPAFKFEVQGIQRINRISDQEGGELRLQEGNLNGGNSHWIIDNFLSFSGGNKFRIWKEDGSTGITVMPNGRVAVGPMLWSEQPQSMLDVEGNLTVGANFSGASAAPANGALIEGNVGIGTTTANAPLQFANTVANRKIVLYQNANNDHQVYGFGVNSNVLRYQVDQTGSDHVFYAAASSSSSNELMRIKGTGNVGIGTSAPAARLHVAGTVRIADGTQGAGKVLASDANGTASWQTLTGLGAVSGTGTQNFIAKWTPNGTTLGNSQLFDNGTNIGIGTTTPGAKLHIAGTIRIADGTQGAGKLLVSDAAGNASWQNNDVHVNATGLANNLTLLYNNAATLTNWTNIDEGGGSNWNNATGEYTISVSGVYSLFVNIDWSANTVVAADPAQRAYVYINRNGSRIAQGVAPAPAIGQSVPNVFAMTEMRLTAGDKITFETYHTVGTAGTSMQLGNGILRTTFTKFGIHLITR